MARAATETQHAGLTGLEFGLAIPGTVGGAVWANAGAHDADMAGVLESARVLSADGTEAIVPAGELGLSYRDSRFKRADHDGEVDAPRDVVVDATFRLSPADPDVIKARLDDIRRWRQAHQPLGLPSAGSVFRNPPRRFGRPADRGRGPEGSADRWCRRLGEARQLHRQRPEGPGRRRPSTRRPCARRSPGAARRGPRVRDRVRRRLDRLGGTQRERRTGRPAPGRGAARRSVGRA